MDKDRAELRRAVRIMKIMLEKEELNRLDTELQLLISWLKPLRTIDTTSVNAVITGHNQQNVMREDRAGKGDAAGLQENAPAFSDGFFTVPPIIE